MAEINLPPVEDAPIDFAAYEAVNEVRRVLQHFQSEPHGDLTLNAERAAFIAVYALRDAGLLVTGSKQAQ